MDMDTVITCFFLSKDYCYRKIIIAFVTKLLFFVHLLILLVELFTQRLSILEALEEAFENQSDIDISGDIYSGFHV